MAKEITNEEQVSEPSEEEKVNEPSEIGSFDDALDRYEKAQTEKSAQNAETEEEKPCETCGDEEETPEANYFVVDKEGNKTPLLFKSDGKIYNPDSPDKVFTWGNLGIHANTELEAVKRDKEEIEKAKPVIEMLLGAFKEGRLSIDGKAIKSKEETEEEEEDETIDPEVAELRKEIKELKDKDKVRDEVQMKKEVLSQYDSLNSEISKHKDSYFAALVEPEEEMPKGVWTLLGEIENDKPKYNPEEAMKVSHEAMLKFVDKLLDAHPELIETKRKDIIAKYLKDKEEKEKAPVSTPSEIAAGVKTTPEQKEFKGVSDAVAAAQKYFEEKEKAGQKS